ncbi:MAG TPA: hypothetical protein VN844_22615 [Pyrinomonadaceae bacterium]|nr:hypothetical protein [Pyrinomonadaceae bacterium]
MEERYTTERLLALRKLTRTIAELLRSRMKDYLSTFAPLMHPKNVLGNYVGGQAYEVTRIGEKPFAELRDRYLALAQSRRLSLPPDLKTPLELINPQLEMNPVEYEYVATSGGQTKTVTITSPLKWSLSYAGFPPSKLKALLQDKSSRNDDLQQFVLHSLMMESVILRQTGISQMLEALHFPLSVERAESSMDLPVCYVSSSVSTTRPPDDVIIQSTEISGMDAFEEIVNIEDVARLRDPLKEKLSDLVKDYVEQV